MRTELEKNVLRKEVLTSKEEVLSKIENLIRNTSLGEEVMSLMNLKEKLDNTSLPRIPLDLDKDEVDSYFIMIEEGKLYRAQLSGFYFEYDNINHELYLSSFTSDTEDSPII